MNLCFGRALARLVDLARFFVLDFFVLDFTADLARSALRLVFAMTNSHSPGHPKVFPTLANDRCFSNPLELGRTSASACDGPRADLRFRLLVIDQYVIT